MPYSSTLQQVKHCVHTQPAVSCSITLQQAKQIPFVDRQHHAGPCLLLASMQPMQNMQPIRVCSARPIEPNSLRCPQCTPAMHKHHNQCRTKPTGSSCQHQTGPTLSILRNTGSCKATLARTHTQHRWQHHTQHNTVGIIATIAPCTLPSQPLTSKTFQHNQCMLPR